MPVIDGRLVPTCYVVYEHDGIEFQGIDAAFPTEWGAQAYIASLPIEIRMHHHIDAVPMALVPEDVVKGRN